MVSLARHDSFSRICQITLKRPGIIERLGDLFADPAQRLAAVRAGARRGMNHALRHLLSVMGWTLGESQKPGRRGKKLNLLSLPCAGSALPMSYAPSATDDTRISKAVYERPRICRFFPEHGMPIH